MTAQEIITKVVEFYNKNIKDCQDKPRFTSNSDKTSYILKHTFGEATAEMQLTANEVDTSLFSTDEHSARLAVIVTEFEKPKLFDNPQFRQYGENSEIPVYEYKYNVKDFNDKNMESLAKTFIDVTNLAQQKAE